MNTTIQFHRRDAELTQSCAEENSLRTSVQPLRLCGEIIALFFLFFVTSCRSLELKPVDIAAEDMCTHCKMAISAKEFAAEFLNQDGDAFKFDDIGCLLDYLKEKPDAKIAAYFFVDYETKQWVKSNEANFVKSAEITAPMGGGLIAFHDRTKAEAAAAKFKGKKLNFEELTKQ